MKYLIGLRKTELLKGLWVVTQSFFKTTLDLIQSPLKIAGNVPLLSIGLGLIVAKDKPLLHLVYLLYL